MRKAIPLLITAFVLGPQAALAQKPSAEKAVVVASEAGKAAIVAMAEITATVVAIDKATRSVTLKGPQGRTVDVIAGDAVRNFDQIRVGDSVVAQYQEALTLELKKAKAPGGATETVAAARAKPGERPAGAVGREITVLADVVAVDPKKSIISLKGPRGNIVDLKVQNPDHFKVVKVGDQVEAVYSEALAIAVTPAPKTAGKK
jgi:DNA-binding beta-propeller fold protein YncE